MKKNTTHNFRKFSILVLALGLSTQMTVVYSQTNSFNMANTSTCRGNNVEIERAIAVDSPPSQGQLAPVTSPVNTEKGLTLHLCQTDNLTAGEGDTIRVNIRTTLPDTTLVVNTGATDFDTTRFLTIKYSKPGVYNSSFLVTNIKINNTVSNAPQKISARGEAINIKDIGISTKISPMSVMISRVAKRITPVMPFVPY